MGAEEKWIRVLYCIESSTYVIFIKDADQSWRFVSKCII